MKLNTTGATRLVIILNNHVIKIPNFTYSYHHFIKGILANLNEASTWDIISKYTPYKAYLLCPVTFSFAGIILIMKKANVEKHINELRSSPIDIPLKQLYKPWINNGLGGDDKPDNYGYLNDRLVKIDYGS